MIFFCLLLAHLGITVISIPFWWDRSLESLAATIAKQRPDLEEVGGFGSAIPDVMPVSQSKRLFKRYAPNVVRVLPSPSEFQVKWNKFPPKERTQFHALVI